MEKPFYFLMLFGGILSISSYPMNNEDENKGCITSQEIAEDCYYNQISKRSEIEEKK